MHPTADGLSLSSAFGSEQSGCRYSNDQATREGLGLDEACTPKVKNQGLQPFVQLHLTMSGVHLRLPLQFTSTNVVILWVMPTSFSFSPDSASQLPTNDETSLSSLGA